jgi:hypothetical protein
VRQLAESDTTARQISSNLGVPATRQITEAAKTQSESLRRILEMVNDPKKAVDEIDGGDLATMIASTNSGAMAITKARGTLAVLRYLGDSIPESRSRTIVDMLFSRDPAMTQRALNALRAQGEQGRETLGLIINTLASDVGEAITEAQKGDPSLMLEPTTDTQVEERDLTGVDPEEMTDEELIRFIQENDAQQVEPENMTDEELIKFIQENDRPYGRQVIEELFPGVEVTEDLRDGESDLGRKNPKSYHVNTDGAVDVRPIPEMTFEEFVAAVENAGYNVVESRDEVNNPSGHATGPHWHIVIGE